MSEKEDKKIKLSKPDDEDKSEPEETPREPEAGVDHPKTNEAVDDILKEESGTVLAAEDAKLEAPKKKSGFKAVFGQKKIIVPLVIVVALAVVFGLPTTRYKILALFLKQTYSVKVVDSQTGQPVSEANVTLSGTTVKTDNAGKATLKVKLGSGTLVVTKKYYTTTDQKTFVGLTSAPAHSVKVLATGRQVPVVVVNKISGAPISDADITAAGTKAKTNSSGKVIMVLPANKKTVSATVTTNGYNDETVTIQITTAVVASNTFGVTPTGTIYFLSNATGKVNVVSTNLDGSNQETVVAGTGNENAGNTELFNSNDWRYLILFAQRSSNDTDNAIYLINTNTGKLTTLDEGTSVQFNPIGWSGHNFIYTVNRNSVNMWDNDAQALKTYNADTGQLTTIAQTIAFGTSYSDYISSQINNVTILGSKIVYNVSWNGVGYQQFVTPPETEQMNIVAVNANGTGSQTLKSFPAATGEYGATYYGYVNQSMPQPGTIDFQVYQYLGFEYYEYDGTNFTQDSSLNSTNFGQNPISGTPSPSGKVTLLQQTRNGNTVFLIGDASGNNGKVVATLPSTYSFYGWYNNSYFVVSNNRNVLYIVPVSGLSGGQQPVKISSYDSGQPPDGEGR